MKTRIPLKEVELIKLYYPNVNVDKLHIFENNSTFFDEDSKEDFLKATNKLKFAKIYSDTKLIYIIHNNVVIFFNEDDSYEFIYTFHEFLIKFLDKLKNSNQKNYKKSLFAHLCWYSNLDKETSLIITNSILKENLFEVSIKSMNSNLYMTYIYKDFTFYFKFVSGLSGNSSVNRFKMENSMDKNWIELTKFKDIRCFIKKFLEKKGHQINNTKDFKDVFSLIKLIQY